MLDEIMQQPKVLGSIEQENIFTLNAIVTELKDRGIHHALFAARGTSDNASIFGQYLFGIYQGIVTGLAIPSCITLYSGNLALNDELIIAVSQSGEAEDALAVITQNNLLMKFSLSHTTSKPIYSKNQEALKESWNCLMVLEWAQTITVSMEQNGDCLMP